MNRFQKLAYLLCIYFVFIVYLFCICVFHKSGRDVSEMHFRIAFHFAAVSFCISGGLRGGGWKELGPWGPGILGLPGALGGHLGPYGPWGPRGPRAFRLPGALGPWGLGALGLLGP